MNLKNTSVLLSTSAAEAIADRLAADGNAVVDNFLSREEEVRRLRSAAAEAYAAGAFKKAGIGRFRQVVEEIRGDFIQWVDPQKADAYQRALLGSLAELGRALNRRCYLGLKGMEIHQAVYPPGKGYRRHLDVLRGSNSRKVSIVLYLNESWMAEDGGILRLYLPAAGGEQSFDIMPLGGRLACFLSEEIEHEVLPATRERYSITGWLKDTPSSTVDPVF